VQTRYAWLLVGLVAISCGDDSTASNPPPADDGGNADATTPDASDDATADAGADAVNVDAPIDVVEEPDAELSVCDQLGLPSRPFVSAPDDPSLSATAADLTLPTTEGDWTLSENWTGCETYLFIQDQPRQATGWSIDLWERDVAALFDRAPKNTHFFFLSTATNPSAVTASLDALRAEVDAALIPRPKSQRDWWWEHVHYVTTPATQLDGWLGDVMAEPAWGVGIDRSQRIRYIGSYADPQRYDDFQQWFAPNLSMAANEAIYYNFEAEREAGLADTDTVLPLFSDVLASENPTIDVELPAAAGMAAFDTLELDVFLGCGGAGEYGECPAWDRIVSLYLCDETDPSICETEIGRWITTYHREGRWVHDVSPLLPLIAAGGTRRFRFTAQDPWQVTASIRLSNEGKTLRATHAWPLFTSGSNEGFDEGYNDLFDAITVTVPASAQRVEIASMITGHGMSMPGNCAEFCNTTHEFLVNGDVFTRNFPKAGNAFGCMDQVAEGTVPNQYGTWWYGRSGWCPGKEVPLATLDVTASIIAGDNTVDLQAWFNGQPYTGDNWRFIDHASWLVAYE
jgi:Peptide-N-glycosidase F, C terminal